MQQDPLTPAVLPGAALLDGLQIGIVLEQNRKLTWANRRFLDLFGCAQQHIEGSSTRSYFQSDADYDKFTALQGNHDSHGKPASIDLALQRRDGSAVWCRISGNPVETADPAKGYLWSFSDLSDRVLADMHTFDVKDDLAKALARQEAILRSLQTGVMLVKERKVIWGNERLFAILGFAPADLVGQGTRVYFCSDEDFKSIETEGYPLLRAGLPFGKEIALLRKNGEKVWCHIIGNAVDLNDLTEGFIWSFADITARVHAEQQMREAKESLARTLARQDAILRSLQVGVLLARNRQVEWANQRFFEMLGFTASELVGQPTSVYFSSEQAYDLIEQQGYPLLCEGKPFATEMPMKRKDGSLVWCHVTGNAVNLHDLDQGFIWSFADIHDRVLAERRARESIEREQLMEAEKMAALGMVVAGVAHEINTPIGVSYTLVTHFKRKTREFQDLFASGAMKKSDLQKFVDLSGETATQLSSNVTRAAELIQSFKQVAVDQSRDDQREFELKAYLQEIATSLMPTLRKTPHRIVIDCPEPVLMNSYPGALSQVMTNLVMNAVIHAFEDEGEGIMTIAALHDGQRLQISFADNGKGISSENLPRIFDPFFTTRRGAGGSGLGLNIVFNLVTRKLQGTIACDSVLGQGTVFRIEIPAMIDENKFKNKNLPQ